MTSQDFTKTETAEARADFLVELRGFEPMAIAVSRPRNRGISPVNLKGDERQIRLRKATQP